MEQLLQYVWKHKIYPFSGLKTTNGEVVEVIDAGLQNQHAGPDFFNAKLKIGDVLWVGNVEVHEKASAWYSHGHHLNPAYANVILHVVGDADAEIFRYGSTEKIPQVVLPCPDEVKRKYALLKRMDTYPACYAILRDIPMITLHSWLSALTAERIDQRAGLIYERLKLCENNWEHALFITLARNFGFGLNGDVFEAWAKRINLAAVGKHRDDLRQIEAIFFGMAGLLEDNLDDSYYRDLQQEYRYLSHKFGFSSPIQTDLWKLSRIRPQVFPHIKIAQLAYLYHNQESLLSKVLEAKSIESMKSLLQTSTSSYWNNHYLFGKETAIYEKSLGNDSLNLMLINTFIPFLVAYGKHKGCDEFCHRASDFLEQLKPENNYIIRQWERFGIIADHAADSQALIQLRKEYCDKRDCLRCRIGYQYLKVKKTT
ncbi:MAG: DUF2851 family protein [Bacteroidaceae bacterium]|nr:DUF2851 family protein [Bacteroidaceae bacterium]